MSLPRKMLTQLEMLIIVMLLCILLFALYTTHKPLFKESYPATPCLSPEEVTDKHTPAELAASSIQCLDEKRAEEAIFLIEIMRAYFRFDVDRFTDRVRHAAVVKVLEKQTTSTQETRLIEGYSYIANDPASLSWVHRMCEIGKQLRMPTYYPDYLLMEQLPEPLRGHLPYAPLNQVKILTDAETQLLYNQSHEESWKKRFIKKLLN